MKLSFAVLASSVVLLMGCENKQAVSEQRKAQETTDTHILEVSGRVDELLVRNEAMMTQLERLNTLESRLGDFERKRLEELKEATKPRNLNVDAAVESALRITTLTDPKIRELVCPLLSRMGGKDAEYKLLDMVKNDREPEVRSCALKGLVDMNSQRVIPILNETIMVCEGRALEVVTGHMRDHCNESSRKPALAVLHTLKQFDDNGDQENVRENLYRVLAQVGKPEDVSPLKVFFERENDKEHVMAMLLQIDRKQALEILNQAMATAEKDHARQFVKFMVKYADDSSRQPILDALDNLVTMDDYQARQARESLYKVLHKIGKPADNARIEQLLKMEESNRKSLMELFVATGVNRKKAVFKQLDRSAEGRVNLSKATFQHLRKYADLRTTKFLIKYLTKYNDYYTSPMIIEMLTEVKDPLAATTLVAWLKKGRTDKSQRLLRSAFIDGYPGVTYNEETKEASVVGDAELKKLMEARLETIIQLESGKPPQKAPIKKAVPEEVTQE